LQAAAAFFALVMAAVATSSPDAVARPAAHLTAARGFALEGDLELASLHEAELEAGGYTNGWCAYRGCGVRTSARTSVPSANRPRGRPGVRKPSVLAVPLSDVPLACMRFHPPPPPCTQFTCAALPCGSLHCSGRCRRCIPRSGLPATDQCAVVRVCGQHDQHAPGTHTVSGCPCCERELRCTQPCVRSWSRMQCGGREGSRTACTGPVLDGAALYVAGSTWL
jgi:hypothetical protein